MKVFITKHVLTNGIIEVEVEEVKGSPKMVKVKYQYGYNYFHGKDWHKDYPSAKKRAEEIVCKKIKSMENGIEKLKNMTF